MIDDPGVTSALSAGIARVAPGTPPTPDAERQRIKQMAQEFEALLMTQMLREMRHSMLPDDEHEHENGLGRATTTDMFDIELGRALSRAGGVGLSGVLYQAITQRMNGGTPQASPDPSALATAPATSLATTLAPAAPSTPTASPAEPVPARPSDESSIPDASSVPDGSNIKVPAGHVSSAYGWRRDPFTGVAQFHRGIDVAVAYGHDVQAAAAGRVAFAGNSGTYGTAVVIEHEGGRQTRYAHLSLAGVRPGDLVDAGQVIGKSGDSGRSTGPHLHFEVLDAGRAVDPESGS